MAIRLARAIEAKTARIGVVGLGYVGLPLALRFAQAGFRTIGLDTDTDKVSQLRRGRTYLRHLAAEQLMPLIAQGRLEPTDDLRRLRELEVILICVPTPLSASRDPDLSCVTAAAQSIARWLRTGQLVVLESTSFPGTTREVVLPILVSSGLRVGQDYYLAFSPEREDPGNRSIAPEDIPKVVGGLDEMSRLLAAAVYRHVAREVVPVSSCEAAEATKMLENTYRAVNIALVNELKMLFDRLGIDIWEVIAAAKTKPFGFQAFYPGPGLGGHCIPIDPFYLSYLARQHDTSARFIELAGEINSRMPDYVFERLATALNERGKPLRGSQICLLGAAYKPNIDDIRGSPAVALLKRLMLAGAMVTYHDPYVPRLHSSGCGDAELLSVLLTEEFLASQDALVIVTAHSAYDYDWIVNHSRLIVDTRNATRNVTHGRGKIRKA